MLMRRKLVVGNEVFIENLQPVAPEPALDKRQEGLEGFIIEEQPGVFIIRHSDKSLGVYWKSEVEWIHHVYWYKFQKFFRYRP